MVLVWSSQFSGPYSFNIPSVFGYSPLPILGSLGFSDPPNTLVTFPGAPQRLWPSSILNRLVGPWRPVPPNRRQSPPPSNAVSQRTWEVDKNFWAQTAADQAAGREDDEAKSANELGRQLGGGGIPFNTQFLHDDYDDWSRFGDEDGSLVDVRKLKDNIWKGLDIVVPQAKAEGDEDNMDERRVFPSFTSLFSTSIFSASVEYEIHMVRFELLDFLAGIGQSCEEVDFYEKIDMDVRASHLPLPVVIRGLKLPSTTTPGAPDAPPFAPPPHPRPSLPTLYKHVLGRRRIFIYTLPPVEVASIFCQVAVDMAYEDQVEVEYGGTSTSTNGARSRRGGRLQREGRRGRTRGAWTCASSAQGCRWESAHATGTRSARIPWREREWGAIFSPGAHRDRPLSKRGQFLSGAECHAIGASLAPGVPIDCICALN
ncbi:hypothetical protein B0H14DRAFT_2583728 [Mycena olivaceomarginata]|nr:hypothetical protein B0H14DRAFT_2583728 [Mycena olivaceomarginata]